MAISLEELAAGALEGSLGPWSLAVGAGALAVALAAGSVRPIQRMTATSVVAAERAGRLRVTDWLGVARREWAGLVDEARAEYDAARGHVESVDTTSIAVASASGYVPEPGSIVVPATPATDALTEAQPLVLPPFDDHAASRVRDQRGRFVRRGTNGARPE
jgi:hypothetical protein